MAIILTLPWPVSVNAAYMPLRGKRGHMMTLSPRGREYKKLCVDEIHRQLGGKPEPMTGRIGWSMRLFAPDRRERDISNHIKIVEDCLTKAGVWEDDKLVDQLHVYRDENVKAGAAVIEIWEVDK